MKFSEIAMKVMVAKKFGIIRSNAQFAREFKTEKELLEALQDMKDIKEIEKELLFELSVNKNIQGFICAFDKEFPLINVNAKNSEKPYLLFYKGDISLIETLNNNVAVIGCTDTSTEIEKRAKKIVESLVNKNLVIVSGLAKGCDEIAHRGCIEFGGKTIAILPSNLEKISPVTNAGLANEIVASGGLLLTEYYLEPTTKMEAINRYIERDRLQALFAKAIVLVASYKKGEGDSGARHAMKSGDRFKIPRYVMYNEEEDCEDKRFGLNRELVETEKNIKIITNKSIDEIHLNNSVFLDKNSEANLTNQITFRI